jgi:hypothetical protein
MVELVKKADDGVIDGRGIVASRVEGGIDV